MNRRIYRRLSLFSVLPLLSAALWGQANTSLRGIITDQSSSVVPKAQVSLINTATGLERKTTSRGSGDYEFLQVVPGLYRVVVEASGFKRYEANDLQLQVNNPATVNIVLEVGGTTQTVAVTAEAPLLNTTDAGEAVASGSPRRGGSV